MTETVTVALAKPVTNGETTIAELTFREPTVGDLIIGDQMTGQLSKMTAILASGEDGTFKDIATPCDRPEALGPDAARALLV